jgi:N-acetylglutamate synthase-like GNAT family acetyltransferase
MGSDPEVTVQTAEGEARSRAVEFFRTNVHGLIPKDDEILVTAELPDHTVIGAVRLAPEAEAWTLRTMLVLAEFRGKGIGEQILNHLQTHMEGRTVHCLAYAHLERFYGLIGLKPVDAMELPELLQARVAEYQDDKGCLPLRRLSAKPFSLYLFK